MSKIQFHLSADEWQSMFEPALAQFRTHLGPDTTLTEDEIQRAAAMDPDLPATWQVIKQFWWACVRDEIPPIKCTYAVVQFVGGPYVRLEVDYPGSG